MIKLLIFFLSLGGQHQETSFKIPAKPVDSSLPTKKNSMKKRKYLSLWSSLPLPLPGVSLGIRTKTENKGHDFSVGVGALDYGMFFNNKVNPKYLEMRYLYLNYFNNNQYLGLGSSFYGINNDNKWKKNTLGVAPKAAIGVETEDYFFQIELTPFLVAYGPMNPDDESSKEVTLVSYPHAAVEFGFFF